MGDLALLGRLISRTFQPVKIHLPIKNLIGKNYKYGNELFNFNLNCTDNNIKIRIIDNKNTKQYSYMSSFLHFYDRYDLDLPITKYHKDKNLLTIHTAGHIPIRWIYICKDMLDIKFSIEHINEKEIIEYEHSIINNITNINNLHNNNYRNIISKLYNLYYDKRAYLKFKVLEAPSYTMDDAKERYVLTRISQSYQYNYEDITKQLEDCKWSCYDHHYTIPTSIFMNKSRNYYCLGYFCSMGMKWYSNGYSDYFSGAKYFPMNNVMKQPWYKFLNNYDMGLIKNLSCGDEDTYSNNETINFEEIVILKEILKKEGAKIKIL